MPRLIQDHEIFSGPNLCLRLVTQDDCTPKYLSWLQDPRINQYLETRWQAQTIESIRAFIEGIRSKDDSYLFAIIDRTGMNHIGNIKIGPIHPIHRYADVSYFIGDPSAWGKGFGTEAVILATRLAFDRLKIHRCQAGLYEGNIGSRRILEKAGYQLEGRFKKQLTTDGTHWEDHLWYGICAEDWRIVC